MVIHMCHQLKRLPIVVLCLHIVINSLVSKVDLFLHNLIVKVRDLLCLTYVDIGVLYCKSIDSIMYYCLISLDFMRIYIGEVMYVVNLYVVCHNFRWLKTHYLKMYNWTLYWTAWEIVYFSVKGDVVGEILHSREITLPKIV